MKIDANLERGLGSLRRWAEDSICLGGAALLGIFVRRHDGSPAAACALGIVWQPLVTLIGVLLSWDAFQAEYASWKRETHEPPDFWRVALYFGYPGIVAVASWGTNRGDIGLGTMAGLALVHFVAWRRGKS